MNRWTTLVLLLIAAGLLWPLFRSARADVSLLQPEHPDWVNGRSIYEVNVRQFSTEGTLAGFRTHLPRLKELGVGILWLMPVQPIGELKRKGSLGSPYSIRDYCAINPDLGSLEDFRALVREAHELDMYVILDWVANHCSWDNALVSEHADWFTRNEDAEMIPPVADWSDVVDFDYSQPALRKWMGDAMRWWLRETDIDGFRCDVAGMVPLEFWEETRPRLEEIKPVFMLAEWDDPALQVKAFDMSYAWDLHHLLNRIAQGESDVQELREWIAADAKAYRQHDIRMLFTTNHDENSWNGTELERLGAAADACWVLCATLKGMPLVYTGQELPLDKRLDFFEHDPVCWAPSERVKLLSTLLGLRRKHEALHAGMQGAPARVLNTTPPESTLAYVRSLKQDKVLMLFNFSPEAGSLRLRAPEQGLQGVWRDALSGEVYQLSGRDTMQLPAWGYQILVR